MLRLPTAPGIRAQNGGLFVSRGRGIHPRRVIGSHEMIFVVGGALHMRESGARFDLQVGQTLLLWPEREHAGTAPYDADTSFYWVHFEVNASPEEEQGTLALPQVTTVARPEVLTSLFRRFLDDQESGTLSPPMAGHLIALMLHEAALPLPEREGTGQAAVLARHAHQYVVTHHAEAGLSASRIAQALGCHPDHLGRCFRAVYGFTLTESIHRQRLKRARALLMDGNATVDEIARVCGFPGTAFFRRIFHRYEGVSPSVFRRLHARIHINTL